MPSVPSNMRFLDGRCAIPEPRFFVSSRTLSGSLLDPARSSAVEFRPTRQPGHGPIHDNGGRRLSLDYPGWLPMLTLVFAANCGSV